MLLRLACLTLLERTSPKSLTSTPHKRMIFSFEILDLLETAYIWVCMSVMPHKEKHKLFPKCSLFRNGSRMLLLLFVRWFCNSLTNAHTCKNLKIGSCKRSEWRSPCGRVLRIILLIVLWALTLWEAGVDPGGPGRPHMPQSVYASPRAHSLVLDTVCRSARFFLHLSGADQIPGLAFWIWNKKRSPRITDCCS